MGFVRKAGHFVVIEIPAASCYINICDRHIHLHYVRPVCYGPKGCFTSSAMVYVDSFCSTLVHCLSLRLTRTLCFLFQVN